MCLLFKSNALMFEDILLIFKAENNFLLRKSSQPFLWNLKINSGNKREDKIFR